MSKETQASSAPKTEKDDIDVPEFNEQQMEYLNSFFNKAFASRMREYDTKQDKRHAELLERLSAAPEASKKKNEAKEEVKESDPEVLKMKKQLEAFEKREADRKAKDLANAKKNILSDMLSKLGVPANKLKIAQAYLDHSGYLEQEDEETLHFKFEDQKSDLRSGLKKWFKTEEGKEFLPPVGIKGSGEQKVQSSMYSTSDKNKSLEEIQNDLIAKALQSEDL